MSWNPREFLILDFRFEIGEWIMVNGESLSRITRILRMTRIGERELLKRLDFLIFFQTNETWLQVKGRKSKVGGTVNGEGIMVDD